jgi:hypothetical protein
MLLIVSSRVLLLFGGLNIVEYIMLILLILGLV